MTRVRFLGPDTDAYVASVERHAPEFEERTGIELDVQIVPSDLYFSNRIEHLLDGDEAADVYMARTWERSVTSTRVDVAEPPLPTIASATARAACSSRSATTTFPPSAAMARQAADPIPPAAPVTMTTRSSTRPIAVDASRASPSGVPACRPIA